MRRDTRTSLAQCSSFAFTARQLWPNKIRTLRPTEEGPRVNSIQQTSFECSRKEPPKLQTSTTAPQVKLATEPPKNAKALKLTTTNERTSGQTPELTLPRDNTRLVPLHKTYKVLETTTPSPCDKHTRAISKSGKPRCLTRMSTHAGS